MQVQKAHFRRIGLSDEKQYGEVEVTVEGREQPLIAVFERNGADELVLHSVSENHEDFTLDWYENPLHQAQQVVTESLFAGPDAALTEENKQQFMQSILSFEDVKHQLDIHLD
ncbi:hypothetical protein [Paenibacillus turpanensis]|uniref:hypothetical protein n=1 Tax=Paenibacillus turpanensis TaxID=2689078 RepID=UPI00140D1C70|nr:hypothetical protein [Paenibacillus turpanensis]